MRVKDFFLSLPLLDPLVRRKRDPVFSFGGGNLARVWCTREGVRRGLTFETRSDGIFKRVTDVFISLF